MVSRPQEVSTDSEEILHDPVNRREPLELSGRRETPHLALPLTRRLVGDLGSIVRVLISEVDHRRHHGAARGGIGAQLVGDQSSSETALGVQQRPKESDGIVKLSGGWHSRHMTSQTPNYHGYRFPPEIISHAVWLYHRFCLSFRDAEDLLTQRGVTVTYETIRHWCHAFGPDYARRLRRGRGRMGDTWYLDELFVNIQGRRQYLWRAVDQDGDLIDIIVQSRRDRHAATRFFRKLLKGQGREPRRLITDKLRSYAAAHRTVMPSVRHSTQQYENNRAEVSHQPTRQRERQMRRFTSAAQAQRFLSVHGVVLNLFRVGRHLLRAVHHRLLRTRAFGVWREVTCV